MRKNAKTKVSKKNPFLNERVVLTLKMNVQKTEYNEGQGTELIRPITMPGYLLNEDENYLYLGDGPEEISFYVDKTTIGFVEKMLEVDKYDTMMDDMSGQPVITSKYDN